MCFFVCCSFFVLQRWWRCGDLPYSDCYRRSIACSRRGSRCKATARLLPCEIPADNKKQAVSTACFFGGDAGFVANIVCVITERKYLHFKAECQPGYRGSHGDAVLRFFKIAINPRIDDIEKQVEQEVQLVSRLVEMRGLPYSDCYRRSIACSRRGSHGDAVLRFFKIAINPRIDDIEKQVEQEVQLVSRLVEMRGFEPRFVLLHPTPSTCLFGD